MKKASKRAKILMMLAGLVVVGTGLAIFRYASASGDATFAISPSSGSYSSGATINVDVSENSSAGDNTNAVQVNLSFPSSLSWQSTTLTGPFTLCAQNTHTATTVSLACAATTAQAGTQAIATVSFKVVGTGSAIVAFTAGSDIDNTSGTSVFSGTLPSATYTLPAPSAPAPTPTPTKAATTTTTTKTPTPTATPAPTHSATPTPTASPSPTVPPVTSSRGSLSVTVTGSNGQRLNGATVKLDDQTAKTNSSGLANFAGVYSGSHTLTITAAGENTLTANITVASGENKIVSYKLTKAINWIPIALTILGALIGIGAIVWAFRFWRQTAAPVTNLGSDSSPNTMGGVPPATPSNPQSPPVTQFKPSVPTAPLSSPANPQPPQPGPPSDQNGPTVSGHNPNFQ